MNILVQIAQENPTAYCVSSQTVQTAINRNIPKEAICIALVDIMAENTGTFYLEDANCCCFVAMRYQKT